MNIRCSVLLFVIIACGLFSCKNNDEVFTPVVSTFLTVVNASTDTLNYYLNGTRQNNSSSLFPGGSVVYLSVPAGLQNYQFKKAGTSPVLFSIPLTLKDTTDYSLFITGESADKSFYTLDQIDTATNRSTLRFVNAAPDAGSLDVVVADSLSFTSRPYKSATAFFTLGNGAREVKIYQTGSSVVLKDTTITFLQNQAYTIFAKGLLNGKGNAAFGMGITLNFPVE